MRGLRKYAEVGMFDRQLVWDGNFKVSFLNISSEMHYIAKVTDLQRKIVKEKKPNKSKYFQDIYERNKNNQYHRLTYLIYYARMFSELSYILTVNLFFFKKQLRKSDNFSFYFIYGLIIYNKYNMYSTCVDSGKHVLKWIISLYG